MNITLNIGMNISNNYLPEGVVGTELQYEYVQEYLMEVLGSPNYIGLAESDTEKTVVAEYSNVEDVLKKLFWLAYEFEQDCIAYSVQDGDNVLGGALVGNFAHKWNYGIFDEAYFIRPMIKLH